MRIIKVFNNNSVVALSNDHKDVILTGKGIGYKKNNGDLVDEEKIERIYVFEDKNEYRFKKCLKNIPNEYFELTGQIVDYAISRLNVQFSSEIFLAMIDYFLFVINRQKQGVVLSDIIVNETKLIYKDAYEVGLWAVHYTNERMQTNLQDDEAGYIALYLVNYSLSVEDQTKANDIMIFVDNVVRIVEKKMNVCLCKESLEYSRLSMHLKLLAESIIGDLSRSRVDTTFEIRTLLEMNPSLKECINEIISYILDNYSYHLSLDEETYLCIHIRRNIYC